MSKDAWRFLLSLDSDLEIIRRYPDENIRELKDFILKKIDFFCNQN
uniref:Uncharacterized protein n=1 Tax=uncultured Desulfobacterium sp. TaxID=201089 RepID=E1YFV7_9BACT|nr:unknown protein [uncultured Desulfobacterium sp.]